MNTARRIGILGGTFDPIHSGHLDLGDVAERTLGLTEVQVITSHVPPHRAQPLASPYHRFAMVALTVTQRPTWRSSDIELRHEVPSYTTATLQRFQDRGYDPTQLFFIIGADAFADIASWRDYPQILDAAHFVVVSRPGFPALSLVERLGQTAARIATKVDAVLSSGVPVIFLIDAPTANVSSTAIRDRVAIGASIQGMVPQLVEHHIEQHRLYKPMRPGRRAMDAPTHVW
jgi:nicotinate-nucleotide adenylyltransferase